MMVAVAVVIVVGRIDGFNACRVNTENLSVLGGGIGAAVLGNDSVCTFDPPLIELLLRNKSSNSEVMFISNLGTLLMVSVGSSMSDDSADADGAKFGSIR